MAFSRDSAQRSNARMRAAAAALAFLVGCHGNGGDDAAIEPLDAASVVVPDADPCAAPPPIISGYLSVVCKPLALANLDLDGSWTMTGHLSSTAWEETDRPVTARMVITRQGPGWCGLTMRSDISGVQQAYNDDSHAAYNGADAPTPHYSWSLNWVLCVNQDDDMLTYEEYGLVQMGGGYYDHHIVGVLTR